MERFRARYGADRVLSDPMEAAYFGVHLWAQAVEEARTPEVQGVLAALRGQSLVAPGGMVNIDMENNHTWKTVRVGKIRPDGQFDVVWDSGQPIRPVPYPSTRSRADWDTFLQDLHMSWGGRWVNPGPGAPTP